MTLTETTRRGFTLIELMVVVGMILILVGAMSTAVSGAMARARRQKAASEVKIITQAILAYENETRNGEDFELPTLDKAECSKDTLGFLLGRETSQSGQIPVLLMAALSGGGKMLDPWGHPYRVTIKKNSFTPRFKTMTGSMQTGLFLPNFYRLTAKERGAE